MVYSYNIQAPAQEEYELSISWYKERKLYCCRKLCYPVNAALINICKDPKRQLNSYKDYYHIKIRKYPFSIIYTIDESTKLITIIAIYHQKRHPENKYR